MPISFSHDLSSSLDVFDEFIKNYLEPQIRDLGYEPSELLPVINVAIEESKRSLSGIISKGKLLQPPSLLRMEIAKEAYRYIRGVLSQSKKWNSALQRIRSYRSIFLVGAGISFESGIPLTRVLSDLLKFCRAKNYDELRGDEEKCYEFKLKFKEICNNKRPSASHKLIALNFPDYILEIICLNWDNLIERAFRENNKPVPKVNEDRHPVSNKRYLWKFHGDVENIKKDNIRGEGGWVFPDEGGYVFNSFLDYIKKSRLTESMFTFVIVGYSENEKVIYKEVIKRFERKPQRPTFRIGLDLKRLHKKNYIVGPSDFILKKILPRTS